MAQKIDLTGQIYGRLTVIERAPNHGRQTAWLCQCSCGNTKSITSASLRHAGTQSCGCLRTEQLQARTAARKSPNSKRNQPMYRRWNSMRQRCENPNNPSWPNYGGRGITVCERWRESYEAFLSDMGPPPDPTHTIERIDNDGPYSPDNCRWAPRRDQLRNQRTTIRVEIDGLAMSAKDWAAKSGANYQAVTKAYRRHGIEAATEMIAAALRKSRA